MRDRVDEPVGPARPLTTGSLPFTPRAKKVLELSLREALQLGQNSIGTEHLLLGLVREGEGVAAHVLVDLRADLSRVRQQVIGLIPAASSEDREATAEPGRVFGRDAPWRGQQPGLDGPRCGNGDPLENNVGYRALAVQPIGPSATAEPVEVIFVYCRTCGMVVAHLAAAGLRPPG